MGRVIVIQFTVSNCAVMDFFHYKTNHTMPSFGTSSTFANRREGVMI